MARLVVSARLLLAAIGLAHFACGYVSGAEELEIVDSSSAEQEWACVGAGEPLLRTEPMAFDVPVRNLATNQPVDSVVARFCEGEPCTSPVAVAESTDGVLSFRGIDPGFRGYIELESPGMMPTVVELLRPLGAMRKLRDFHMIASLALKTYASTLGESIDDDLGQALFWVENCDGWSAPGVSVEPLDPVLPSTRAYYVVDFELPSLELDRTQRSGGGGFINLPTGFPRFAAVHAVDRRPISTFAARIRPGTVTFFLIEPE